MKNSGETVQKEKGLTMSRREEIQAHHAELPFSPEVRQDYVERMSREAFDVLVIGGGITGAGIARDAALRGLKTALIEKGDFGAGTSSKSSKLVHGGFRYLSQLKFGLVHEALVERRILRGLAPHLVHPLNCLLPIYRGSGAPPAVIQIGMWLYDILALVCGEILPKNNCPGLGSPWTIIRVYLTN